MLRHDQYTGALRPLAALQFLSIFRNTLFCTFFILSCAAGSTATFADISKLLLMMTLTVLLPQMIFCIPAGFLADRIPKRYTLILAAALELILMLVALWSGAEMARLFPILAILISIRALAVPAFYGILPETFPEEDLSRANGTVGIWTYIALLAGIGTAALMLDPFAVLLTCSCLSLLGLYAAFKVRFTIPVPVKQSLLREILSGLRDLWDRPSKLLASLGENFFLAIGTILPLLLILLQNERTGGNSNLFASGLLQTAPVIGFAAGCLLAGRFSAKKIEPGLVPFGALGVALSLFLGIQFSGPMLPFTLHLEPFPALPGIFPLGGTIFLFLAGISGGLFVIPLRTYLQQRLKPETRGMTLAIHQALSFAFSALLCWILFRALHGTISNQPDAADPVSAHTLLLLLGLVTFLVTLFSMWALPDFALRFLIITLGNTIYKLKITGAENIPAKGPALLVSNHVSYADHIFISACTSRRIRFLLNERLAKKSRLLRVVGRLTHFIPLPADRAGFVKMFEKIHAALRAGDIICVYPEGAPTRNSLLGEFRSGFLKMLPPDLPDLPVIPVYIGDMWGSNLSYYRSTKRHMLPLRTSNRATVTIGKPMPAGTTAFAVRQKIAELAAETATENTRPSEYPLHVRLALNAKRKGHRVLMRDSDGTAYTTFSAFLSALLLSRSLRKKLTAEDEYTGIFLPNSTDCVLAILATLYADRVPCPLNYTTPRDVLAATLRTGKLRKVITTRAFAEKHELPEGAEILYLEDLKAAIPGLKRAIFALGAALLPTKELMNLVSPVSREDVNRTALVLFSSGSTGNPKGVMLSHHNVNTDMHSMIDILAFNPASDVILGNLPLFHSFGMNTCFWIPVATGCSVTYLSNPLDAALAGEIMERDKVTILYATPSFLQAYLRKCKPEQFAHLRFMMTGAEKLRADIADRFREFTGGRLTITEGYGCTELSPVVNVNVPEDIADLGRETGRNNSIGPALEDTAAKVVDPLTYEELPPESEGLLFIKGPMVMQGYLNAPERTKAVMANGYYNTGDIVTMDRSGHVYICGRLSRFSKIAGEMVPHEMVECIINELCGKESRVVAVGSIPDPKKGEALLVLYTPETPYTPDEIVAELRERSISNLWIPKAVNFHPVEKLPLLGSGKLDLSLLRKIADQVAQERNLNPKKG